MSLSDQFRKAIVESGLSLYMVAKVTNTPYAVIHGFANGHRNIKLETADKLAELFGMRMTAPKNPKIETAATTKGRGRKAKGR